MIQRITAISNHKINSKPCKNCYGLTFTWDRDSIGDIIENIPKLIKLDNYWINIKLKKLNDKP